MALPSLGFKALTNTAPHITLIYWFLTGVLTILMLQYRNKLVLEEQALQVGLAKQEAELEKQQREQERRFLQMLTHEIKTPLSIIKMASTSKLGSDNFKEYVDTAVTDINQLIERCIATDKVESNQFEPQLEQINLSSLLNKVLVNFGSKAKFYTEIMPAIEVYSDGQLLEIVIANIVENATKYGLKSSPIEVVLNKGNDGKIIFKIANKLAHKGALDTKKIFNKYYRGEFAYEKNGSGLGLYLVRSLLKILGGSIRCKSTEEDVAFFVTLPNKV